MTQGAEFQYIGKGELSNGIRPGAKITVIETNLKSNTYTCEVEGCAEEAKLSESFFILGSVRLWSTKAPEYREGDVIRVLRDAKAGCVHMLQGECYTLTSRGTVWDLVRKEPGKTYSLAKKNGILDHYPECFVIEERLTEVRVLEGSCKGEIDIQPPPQHFQCRCHFEPTENSVLLADDLTTYAARFQFPDGDEFEIPRPSNEDGWKLDDRTEYEDKFWHWNVTPNSFRLSLGPYRRQEKQLMVVHHEGRLIFSEYKRKADLTFPRLLWLERWVREVTITDEKENVEYTKHWEFL